MDEEILEYLNGNSGLQYRELIDLFMQKFPNETDAIYEHIRETLDDMHKNGLIKLKNASTYNALGKMVTIPGNMQGGKELYSLGVINGREGANIEAKITIDGRKVLAELKFKRQLFEVNQSVIITNKIQKNLGISTIVVAVLSFLAIAVSAYYSSKAISEKGLQITNSILKQNTLLLDSMQQSQRGIDSSLRKVGKGIFSHQK